MEAYNWATIEFIFGGFLYIQLSFREKMSFVDIKRKK